MLQENLSVNSLGHLTFAGSDTVLLAEKHGTPLYLMDEARLRANMRLYTEGMKQAFLPGSFPCYASKALSCLELYRIAQDEGMGVDVASGGELYTALKAGFPASRIFFHGNNKTDADLRFAVENDVGTIIVDNRDEALALEKICKECDTSANIFLRVTPGIDPHTHAKICTGKVDSKFGVAIETGQAMELTKEIFTLPHLSLSGFHCHVGSQCFDSAPFLDAAEIMLRFIADVKRENPAFVCEYLDLGGGYGVRYVESHPHIDIPANLKLVSEKVRECCEKEGIAQPKILMEPGRSIVADASITLYTCGSVKTITGYKSYVSIDGGMPDNPRYTLYGSEYTVLNATHADREPDFTATIAGRCCESGDLIQENVPLYTPTRGDKIAVLVTGAYNYSMASNYNRIPRPPIVMLKDGKDRVIVRRESFEDLILNDL